LDFCQRPPGVSGYFTLFILCIINLLNYADRFTLAAVLHDLSKPSTSSFPEPVSDKFAGFLQTSFIASYMLLSPFFGYLGDRWTRKYIIGIGIIFWSLFTLAGSFSVNYWMLLVMRGLVGVGEASYSTVAPTMIADLFPVERRMRALSLFYIAIPFGSGLGYGIGAGMSSLARTWYVPIYPNATHFGEPWRYAFRLTPVLGLITAVLVLVFVREPARGTTDGHGTAGVKGDHGVKAYCKDIVYLFKNPTFILTTVGFTAVTFSTGAWSFWAPTYVARISQVLKDIGATSCGVYGQDLAAALFGLAFIVAGLLGTVSGSEMSKFIGRYTKKAECYVCALSLFGAVPFIYFGLIIAHYSNCISADWPIMFLAIFMMCLNWAPVSAIVLYVVVPARRSTASAISILLSHLLGDAVSPFIVGAVSDSVIGAASDDSAPAAQAYGLTNALYITAFVCVVGGGAFLYASWFVEMDRGRVAKTTERLNKEGRGLLNDDSEDEEGAETDRLTEPTIND
jgi:MFS family permease